MGYRNPGALEQLYYIIKYKVRGAVKALRLRLKFRRFRLPSVLCKDFNIPKNGKEL